MNLKYILCAALSASFLCAALVHSAGATSFLLDEYVEASSEKIVAIAPKLPDAYPGARFLITGFSSPSGEWRFIRVEDTSSCENELCPTIVVHEKVEWKLLVLAKKKIEVSVNLEKGEFVDCKFFSKGNSKIIVRYADGEKTLYVAQ